MALILALCGSKSVFDLVLFAITIMGAGFAPIMLVRVMQWTITPSLAVSMMGFGIFVGILWRIQGYHAYVYEALPGMVSAMIVYGLGVTFLRFKKH